MLPDDLKEAAVIKRKAPGFYYNAFIRTLYRQSYDGILLCYLSHKETQETLREAHNDRAWLTNLDPNLRTDSEGLATAGQK